MFLKTINKMPEVVVSKECLASTSYEPDTKYILKKAAKILRNDMVEKFKNCPQPKWPPSAEELQSETFAAPVSVFEFIKTLITPTANRKSRTSNITRIAQSITEDVVFNIFKGKIMQPKHFLLALGLHNITGSRKVVDIVSKLGHCLNYNTTLDIETAQAERALDDATKNSVLPLQPAQNDYVYTHFWVDNFDVNVDKQIGGGSIHTTRLVGFQQKSGVVRESQTTLTKQTRNHKLFIADLNITSIPVSKEKNPPKTFSKVQDQCSDSRFNREFFLWTYLRKLNSFDQLVPIFKGWIAGCS